MDGADLARLGWCCQPGNPSVHSTALTWSPLNSLSLSLLPPPTRCQQDLVNYTEISSKTDPREVQRVLDYLYSKYDELVEKYDLFRIEVRL